MENNEKDLTIPEADHKAAARRRKHEKSQVKYTRGEEVFNWVTHLTGIILSVIASVFMLIKVAAGYSAGKYGISAIVAVCLFSLGLIAVYSISTAYHLTKYGSLARSIMRRFDHCTITLLIAGSYMPYMLIGLYVYGTDQPADLIWGIVIAAVVIAMAIAVIVLNIVGIQKFRYLTLAGYVIMGWMIVMRIYHLYLAIGPAAIFLLLGGGVAYTVGVLFYKFIKIKYAHGIFHLFVLAGSALMFASVYFFLL